MREICSVDGLVLCLCGLTEYIGNNIDGLDGVHKGHGVDERNFEERILL